MPMCEPCAQTPEHGQEQCEQNERPMILRTCACRCDRREPDPASYWTQQDIALSVPTTSIRTQADGDLER